MTHAYIYIEVYHIKIYVSAPAARLRPAAPAGARPARPGDPRGESETSHVEARETPAFLRRAIQETHRHTGVREEKHTDERTRCAGAKLPRAIER